MLVLAQAPAIAVLILLVFGRDAVATVTAENWPAVAEAIASTMFALAMSAVWLGGSLAVWASLASRSSSAQEDSFEARMLASPARRLAVLGGFCIIQCAVLLMIVHWGSGLRGPREAEFGVLLLTSAVGLSLGLAVLALTRSPRMTAAVLIAAFLAMLVSGKWTSTLTAAMPSRWAFEGLLVQEADAGPTWRPPGGGQAVGPRDLAEKYFPAATRRMGALASVLALGGMFGALACFLGMMRWTSPAQRPA
jgi:hypothetical protein